MIPLQDNLPFCNRVNRDLQPNRGGYTQAWLPCCTIYTWGAEGEVHGPKAAALIPPRVRGSRTGRRWRNKGLPPEPTAVWGQHPQPGSLMSGDNLTVLSSLLIPSVPLPPEMLPFPAGIYTTLKKNNSSPTTTLQLNWMLLEPHRALFSSPDTTGVFVGPGPGSYAYIHPYRPAVHGAGPK